MNKCPCGSGKIYEECCMKYINGSKHAETAEILMRSRYTAYSLGEIDYLINTHDSSTGDNLSYDSIKEWTDSSKWKQLTILDVKDGLEDDSTGEVEFKAFYEQHHKSMIHHERSIFTKKGGIWYYTDHTPVHVKNITTEKIGRNSPCPCGSGKKYKNCCG